MNINFEEEGRLVYHMNKIPYRLCVDPFALTFTQKPYLSGLKAPKIVLPIACGGRQRWLDLYVSKSVSQRLL